MDVEEAVGKKNGRYGERLLWALMLWQIAAIQI